MVKSELPQCFLVPTHPDASKSGATNCSFQRDGDNVLPTLLRTWAWSAGSTSCSAEACNSKVPAVFRRPSGASSLAGDTICGLSEEESMSIQRLLKGTAVLEKLGLKHPSRATSQPLLSHLGLLSLRPRLSQKFIPTTEGGHVDSGGSPPPVSGRPSCLIPYAASSVSVYPLHTILHGTPSRQVMKDGQHSLSFFKHTNLLFQWLKTQASEELLLRKRGSHFCSLPFPLASWETRKWVRSRGGSTIPQASRKSVASRRWREFFGVAVIRLWCGDCWGS